MFKSVLTLSHAFISLGLASLDYGSAQC